MLPPAQPFPESFTPERREELFVGIAHVYDLVDDALATLQQPGITNRSAQVEISTPFFTQVSISANILATLYTQVVRNAQPITALEQEMFEEAFQNIFYAYHDFVESAEERLVTGELGAPKSPSSNAQQTVGAAETLEQKFARRPKKGALQNKAQVLEENLDAKTGAPLVAAIAKLGRHAAQLALEIEESEVGLVRRYDNAVPAMGPSSKLARQAAAKKNTMIDPNQPHDLIKLS